ncbi:hypothetical protein SAMN05444166_2808 [Singulisphaera sp. GP187]|nr:hypothetical protein SAMN05444166_2808 [Singulisphaera sp. GP187]
MRVGSKAPSPSPGAFDNVVGRDSSATVPESAEILNRLNLKIL